jgi:hypothetical protein
MTQVFNFIRELSLKLFVIALGFTVVFGIAVALSTII